jgi:hypothetical protein
MGGRGGLTVPISGSWRSICSSVDNVPVSFSVEGAGASAPGREVTSTVGSGLGSMAVSWAGAERVSPEMSGDAAVAVIGGIVIAGGAVIGRGSAIAGLGRVTSAGRGAPPSSGSSVRFASTLASAERTRASNGFS